MSAKRAKREGAYDVKDIGLADEGKTQIALAEANMQALLDLGERFAREKPFVGKRLAINLHVTKETAVLVRALQKGGAERIALTGCNAFSTQDAIAAALASEGIEVYHAAQPPTTSSVS